MFSKRLVLTAFCSALLFAFGPMGRAAEWPERTITMLVMAPAGAPADVAARTLARDLSASLGQPIVIENRMAGGGVVLMTSVANAKPDGYTLGLTAVGPAVIRPLIDDKVGFEFDRDFTPIMMFGDGPNTLLVSPKLGVNTVQEFVAYAQQHPDTTMAHGGPGTIGHLAAIRFAQDAKIKLNLIAYRGSPQMINDLLSGQISSGFPPYNPAAKNVKILAVATEKRLDFLPDVPTFAEAGYPNVIATTWSALVGPAHMPPEVVAKLNKAINAWMDEGDHRAQFNKIGFRLTGGEPAALTKQVQEDRSRWTGILREHHITFNPQ